MRLAAQEIQGSSRSPAEVVHRMGAMQGQDLPQVLRAIAIRSAPGTGVADVRTAFDRGELVRSWPMRGTLFATTPEHLAVILHWTAGRVHASAARRREQLGIDRRVVELARDVADETLGPADRTRAELLAAWEAAGIATAGGCGYHLIAHLAIAGRLQWGRFAGAEQLLTLRRPLQVADPEAGLARVVHAYLEARGPASVDDAAWWLKLPKTLIRRAVDGLDDALEVRVEGQPMWVVGCSGGAGGGAALGEAAAGGAASDPVLVPGFDEWLLGYQDRSLVASDAALAALVPGGNGVFRPAVLVDGRVVGTWRIPAGRSSRAVEPVFELVEPLPDRAIGGIRRALERWPHR